VKKLNKKRVVITLAFSFIFILFGLAKPSKAFAATSPTLTDSESYSVLASSTVTNTGPTTTTGAVGVSPGTAITNFPPGIAGGGTHSNDASAIAAQADNFNVFDTLDQPCDQTFGAVDLTATFPAGVGPGVYCSTSSFSLTGNLNLTGSGVWIFKTVSTLITSPGSSVTGGDPCNAWWRVGSSATLDTTTSFIGNIFALTSITLNNSATLDGRALAKNGAVTLNTNTISGPICTPPPPATATVHVIKHVINDDVGSATAPDFTIGVTGTNVSQSSFAGSEAGVDVTLDAGPYSIDEDPVSDYTKSLSVDCSGTIAAGETKTCTITNDDIAPGVLPATITVVKVVIGGAKIIADFPLFVGATLVASGVSNTFAPGAYAVTETADPNYTQTFAIDCVNGQINLSPGDTKVCTITNTYVAAASGGSGGGSTPVPPLIDVVKVPSPLALPSGPGLVTYTYTLRNIGTVPVTDVTMVGDSCSPLLLVSGDSNADAKLDVNEIWTYTCSTKLLATHTNTVVATGWANGISATDIANATVVVGLPVVPPLIHVTKIPSPLALPVRGGMVTYTETVTNPGTVALSNIRLTDDKCSPLNYISGDTNGDSKLDVTEAWVYTCRTNLTKTTTNTAVASGEANGLAVRDFAIATVIVAAPGLPKAGFPPEERNSPWGTDMLFGSLMLVSSSLVVTLRKQGL
jgi:type VI secretion system secreted protein VgrG